MRPARGETTGPRRYPLVEYSVHIACLLCVRVSVPSARLASGLASFEGGARTAKPKGYMAMSRGARGKIHYKVASHGKAVLGRN